MILKRFRFHLSTALVLMLLAAGANWYYVAHYVNKPEEWELRIQKFLHENATLRIENLRPCEAYYCAIGQSVVLSPHVLTDSTPIALNFEDQSREKILNQICEKYGAKWTIQQGTIFVCSKSEHFPEWVSYADDPQWSSETRTKLGRRISLCHPSVDFEDIIEFLKSLSGIQFYFDQTQKWENKTLPWFRASDMKFEHVLYWICYQADAKWTLRKRPDGTEEIYITAKSKETPISP